MDEHLGSLGEQQRRLGRDHLHVLVQLHYLLDPSQRQLLLFEVVLKNERRIPWQLSLLQMGIWNTVVLVVILMGRKGHRTRVSIV